MASALFNKYAEDCFDRMLKSLEVYPGSGDNAHLSRFRVSIKKIRVCLACIEYYKGDKIHHIRHTLREYFQQGGDLRALKIYQDWFRKNNLKRLEKITGIDSQISKMDEDFIQGMDRMVPGIEKIQKEITRHSDRIDQERVYHYYTWLIRTGLPLPLGKPAREKWHRLRKKIKRILYARHWQDKQGLKLVSKGQAVFLDDLQHLFGFWHDNEEMIGWLEKEMKKKSSDASSKLAFKRALTLLRASSEKFAARVTAKLKRGDLVLRTLEKRLAKVKDS